MCASSLDGIVFFSVSVLSILGNQLGLFLSFPLFIRFTVSWINFADPLLCLAIFHLSGCFFLVFTSLLYLRIVPTILKCFFFKVWKKILMAVKHFQNVGISFWIASLEKLSIGITIL